MPQNSVVHILRSIGVYMLFQHDMVLRQRASLVSAKHIHGAKVLNGVQIFDNRLFARHL